MRSAGSQRCAGRSIGALCCRPTSRRQHLNPRGRTWFRWAAMRCAVSDERKSCSLSIRAQDSGPNIVSLGETKQLPVILMALLGAVTGALAAAAVDLMPLRDVGGIVLFGHCFGMRRVNECTGAPGAFYLFP